MAVSAVISGVLAAVAVTILAAGVFIGLALNSLALALTVTAGAFCGMGLLGAWAVLRGRFRFPGARPLTGWRVPAAVLLALAFGTGAVVAGVHGSFAWTTVLAVLGVSLGVRVAVARLAGQAEAERAEAEEAWSNEDREWLLLTGAALPEAQQERRLR